MNITYYQPGTALLDKKANRSVRIISVYLKDSLYDAVFIANTFNKDFTGKANVLAGKRLKHIEKELSTTRPHYYRQDIK